MISHYVSLKYQYQLAISKKAYMVSLKLIYLQRSPQPAHHQTCKIYQFLGFLHSRHSVIYLCIIGAQQGLLNQKGHPFMQ